MMKEGGKEMAKDKPKEVPTENFGRILQEIAEPQTPEDRRNELIEKAEDFIETLWDQIESQHVKLIGLEEPLWVALKKEIRINESFVRAIELCLVTAINDKKTCSTISPSDLLDEWTIKDGWHDVDESERTTIIDKFQAIGIKVMPLNFGADNQIKKWELSWNEPHNMPDCQVSEKTQK